MSLDSSANTRAQGDIVDTHVHLWRLRKGRTDWLNGAPAQLRRDFGLRDYALARAGSSARSAILVAANSSLEETADYLAELHAVEDFAAVVGWADIAANAALDDIDYLIDGLGPSKLRGIRCPLIGKPVDWIDRSQTRAGLRYLAARGLVFELLVDEARLEPAVACVRSLPDLAFVLNHAGNPPLAGSLESWTNQMTLLSEAPNVVVKISGLLPLPPARRAVVIRVLIEAFGPDRLMLGSDWPISTLEATYQEALDPYPRDFQILSAADQEKINFVTAERTYGLVARSSN